jgi:hypothetical protein
MGQDWQPNEAMSTELILLTYRETNRLTVFHTFAVVAYIISLRGSEGFLLDIGGLWRHRQLETSNHCVTGRMIRKQPPSYPEQSRIEQQVLLSSWSSLR